MDQYYQIGEAARRAGVTIETLRHYDRIGLIVPGKVDPQTKYRYYSDAEIDQVQIIHYLRSIRFSLPTIKKLLSEEDIPAALETLWFAQDKVDEEIEHLLFVKRHLQDTINNYSTKRDKNAFVQLQATPTVEILPARTVFLAQGLHAPTLGNLMRLHDTVESQIAPEIRGQLRFDNAAGVLIRNESCTLFVPCLQAGYHPNVTMLPAGRYLCTSSSAQKYESAVEQLQQLAAERYNAEGGLVVLDLIFTGMIKWEYEIKLFLDSEL